MFHDKRRGTYRVFFKDKETKKRRSKSFTDPKEGQLFELQVELGLVNLAELKPAAPAFPTFSEYADIWHRDYCKVEKAETQWAEDLSMINYHLRPAFGPVTLDKLKKSHLLELKVALRSKTQQGKGKKAGKKLSLKMINNILGLAKKILNTAVDSEIIEANPWVRVKLFKLPRQQPHFWRPHERDRFLDYAKEMDPSFHDLILVACHTGLRVGELRALRRCDLDFQREMIHVGASYNRKLGKRFETVKGKVAADVPMNSFVLKALAPKRFLVKDAPVFAEEIFRNIPRKLKAYAKVAEVPALRMHDCRHTFASCLAISGMDLMRIQQLCRHESYQMTLRYAHLHPDHLLKATEVLCTQGARKDGLETTDSWNPSRTRDSGTTLEPQVGLEPASA